MNDEAPPEPPELEPELKEEIAEAVREVQYALPKALLLVVREEIAHGLYTHSAGTALVKQSRTLPAPLKSSDQETPAGATLAKKKNVVDLRRKRGGYGR